MSFRSRLFLGIAATVLVSLVVTVVAGALLTRRSLEQTAVQALERQVELIAAQRRDAPTRSAEAELGRFLATDEQRLAIVTPAQAALLLPPSGAALLRAGNSSSGTLDVRGTRFLYAARRSGDEAIVLLRPAASQAADWTPFVVGLGLAGLVGALLAALVALGLARAVARPVGRVAAASRTLAEGGRPDPLPVEGPREVATLARSFNDLSEELDRTHEAERAFLLSVSHELKTPLTAIRGHAEALEDGVLEATSIGSVIEREARRLERLVGDLLDLARLRRRTFSVRSEPVDLAELVAVAYERHAPAARRFGVELQVLASPDAVALADPDRLLQALSNLVENALRSTPPAKTSASSRAPVASRSSTTALGSRSATCRSPSSASISTSAARAGAVWAPASGSRSCASSRRRWAAARTSGASSASARRSASRCRSRPTSRPVTRAKRARSTASRRPSGTRTDGATTVARMRLIRTMAWGWLLDFKQESRNPFFLWIVICTPLIYAISALGIYSLAAGLLYTRILFGISLPIANWVRSQRPCPRRSCGSSSSRVAAEPRSSWRERRARHRGRCRRRRSPRSLAARRSGAARGAHRVLGRFDPRRAYELAAELQPDWSRVEAWLGDERCVPADDERANVRLVRETLVAAGERRAAGRASGRDAAPSRRTRRALYDPA